MPVAQHCGRHGRIVIQGDVCPECANEPNRAARRRGGNNVRLGRNTAHWKRISKMRLKLANYLCELGLPGCTETATTCDLIGGGDHSRARLANTRAACRHCHGKVDGGRR